MVDGVGYRHAALDWQGGIEATWSNPGSRHLQQYALVCAYLSLIESSGILLEPGTRVRVRSGVLAGFIGRVEEIEEHLGRVRIAAKLGGQSVLLDVTGDAIEFPSEGAV
jgi:hypothetical protein